MQDGWMDRQMWHGTRNMAYVVLSVDLFRELGIRK